MKQAGSLVAPNHLRFDFSHFTAVADEELQDIEDIINKEVLRKPEDRSHRQTCRSTLRSTNITPWRCSVKSMATKCVSSRSATSPRNYAEARIPLRPARSDSSKLLKEGSVSSGVRRVEAVTGEGSLHHFRKDHQLENVVASIAAHAEGTSPADALKGGTRQERRRDQAPGPRARPGPYEIARPRRSLP